MSVIIVDPTEARDYLNSRSAEIDRTTEVWDGDTVVAPMPNVEHQEIQFGFFPVLHELVVQTGLGQVYAGVNVSDRAADWSHNYRCPDIAVYLHANTHAINHKTHWQGGPDFLVEIISPGEKPHDKLAFYESIQTREILILHRDPWKLELFQLRNQSLHLTGTSSLTQAIVLGSGVLPLTFELIAGTVRPVLRITHTGTGKEWTA